MLERCLLVPWSALSSVERRMDLVLSLMKMVSVGGLSSGVLSYAETGFSGAGRGLPLGSRCLKPGPRFPSSGMPSPGRVLYLGAQCFLHTNTRLAFPGIP